MPPIKVFDNLYWVGSGAVSAWAIKTSIGLVLIDSMNNPGEGEKHRRGRAAQARPGHG
jgi:hypothetical protein